MRRAALARRGRPRARRPTRSSSSWRRSVLGGRDDQAAARGRRLRRRRLRPRPARPGEVFARLLTLGREHRRRRAPQPPGRSAHRRDRPAQPRCRRRRLGVAVSLPPGERLRAGRAATITVQVEVDATWVGNGGAATGTRASSCCGSPPASRRRPSGSRARRRAALRPHRARCSTPSSTADSVAAARAAGGRRHGRRPPPAGSSSSPACGCRWARRSRRRQPGRLRGSCATPRAAPSARAEVQPRARGAARRAGRLARRPARRRGRRARGSSRSSAASGRCTSSRSASGSTQRRRPGDRRTASLVDGRVSLLGLHGGRATTSASALPGRRPPARSGVTTRAPGRSASRASRSRREHAAGSRISGGLRRRPAPARLRRHDLAAVRRPTG